MGVTIPNVYGVTNANTAWNISTGSTGSVGSLGPQGATGTYTINIASPWPYTENAFGNDVIIKRPGKNDIHVAKTLEALMERLAVIEPNFELMEKYPALREAYENYRVMEALLLGGNNEDENE